MSRKRTIVHVNANITWGVKKTEAGNWLAICDSLKLTLQARTYAELMEDIGLTLDALIKELLSTNDLDRFMREHGWKLEPVPKRTKQEDVFYDVPFEFVRQIKRRPKAHDSSAHVH